MRRPGRRQPIVGDSDRHAHEAAELGRTLAAVCVQWPRDERGLESVVRAKIGEHPIPIGRDTLQEAATRIAGKSDSRRVAASTEAAKKQQETALRAPPHATADAGLHQVIQ